MARRPDYDICISVEYHRDKDNTTGYKYFRVGSAWLNPDGVINMELITMPGVKLKLVPPGYRSSFSKRRKGSENKHKTEEVA